MDALLGAHIQRKFFEADFAFFLLLHYRGLEGMTPGV
jgi:hypothetical protein